MPATFQVVSRALFYELNQLLISFVAIYVDDICGACLAWDLHSDLSLSRKITDDLLGSDSVADEKTEYGVRLDFIRYTVDINNRTISIASWSSYYSMICQVMRPFSSALHRMTSGRLHHLAAFIIPEDAKVSIRLWRAALMLLEYDEAQFSRTFDSFDDGTTRCPRLSGRHRTQ